MTPKAGAGNNSQRRERGGGGADLWESSAGGWLMETLANKPNKGSEDERISSTFVLRTGRHGKVLFGSSAQKD